jgi:protein gp37
LEVTVGDRSAIEWTEATWNPTTGCDQTSPGCDHCYALTLAKRLKAMGQPKYQRDGDPERSGPGFGLTLHPDALAIPLRWKEPRLVFVNSMSDLFHEQVPVDFIAEVFDTMAEGSQHTFQVLTKRSHRLAALNEVLDWPPNVWMGVSIESDRYTFRANHLRSTGAAVKFVSVEPMLGPVPSLNLSGLDWVIAGGESGPAARPMDPAWPRALRDRCVDKGVKFFFKQWGGRTPKAGGRKLDGEVWDEMPGVAV